MAQIKNPVEWIAAEVGEASQHVRAASRAVEGSDTAPAIRKIAVADLTEVLRRGLNDFGAARTDVIFLCLIYPLVGLLIARYAFHAQLLPLIVPFAVGFAFLGPAAAVGLYEMSREREQGTQISWYHAFSALRAPNFGAIFVLTLALLVIFLLWIGAAQLIYDFTVGPEQPASISAFIADVLGTAAGWAMIVIGIGVGFVFAVLVLAISVISFPLLLDRDVGLGVAVRTSVRSVRKNPAPMAAWGLIVAGGLVLGSIPLFLGLIVVIPVLGHATWHLYRKVVED